MLRFRLGVLVVFTALMAAACIRGSKSESGKPPSTKEGSAAQASAFSPSSDALKDLREAIFRLNTAYPYRMTEKMSPLAQGERSMATGTRVVEYAGPDRIHMKWTGDATGDVEAITIGDKHYWYSDGNWTEGSRPAAGAGADFTNRLADMIKNVKYVGPETVNGVAYHLYTCTFDGSTNGQSWSGTSKLWIGVADGLIHQNDSDVRFSGYSGKSHMVYEYNLNFKIEKPVM